ncbi:MFS family permease [Aminobacter ciceronei]|uniref:MFS family permease n=2 Tax=Aminobacter TaxID=31988 RepID=A0ABR6HG92_AMIAI|nr:MFS family permease [Aminobacter ciceronei]MBA9023058.1 MFS family permease [Aminobacter ciceronei]MBB3709522.1 MFS family permease [Aminobacter aminovorans]
MSKPLIVIFVAIVLDAIGIGLVFPILPALLRDVTHADNVAACIGVMTALYAAMQFVFAPVLGSLSDRLGRRPVLLISLAGAVVNYLFLAIAPQPLDAAARPRHCRADQRQLVGGNCLHHRHLRRA